MTLYGVKMPTKIRPKQQQRFKRLKHQMELQEQRGPEIARLLAEAKRKLPELKKLLAETSDHWHYEDPIYRFYHESFKVYRVQATTLKIVEKLQALAPHLKLNPYFR